MAIAAIGGFGPLQILLAVCTSIIRTSGTQFIYIYAFLTLPQQYLCRGEGTADTYESCSASEYICPALAAGQEVDYKVDTSYAFYLNNW